MHSETAKNIFTRYVGHDIFFKTVTETIRYDEKMGSMLKNTPFIRLLQVKAKAEKWLYEEVFGSTDFVTIDLRNVTVHKKDDLVALTVPPTIFGTAHSILEVTYESGYDPLPNDVEQALSEIDNLLADGSITEWNCMLPISVLDVIDVYRKKEV